jgi:hypothetical protein
MDDELTPRAIPPGVYDTAEVVVIGPDGKPMPKPRVIYPDRPAPPRPRYNTLVSIAVALVVLCAFLGGLYFGAQVEASRPVDPSDPGFVNVEGHEGEILVVTSPENMRWTTEAELHEAAGHG